MSIIYRKAQVGIAKKGKRKLLHDGCEYFWWVEDDFDGYATGHSLVVTVVSEDKKFLVKYYIDQRENYFVTVLGSRFASNIQISKNWKRFSCPKFGENRLFKPNDVVDLINWSLNPSIEKREVNYLGLAVQT